MISSSVSCEKIKITIAKALYFVYILYKYKSKDAEYTAGTRVPPATHTPERDTTRRTSLSSVCERIFPGVVWPTPTLCGLGRPVVVCAAVGFRGACAGACLDLHSIQFKHTTYN
jgi:hypothetical protein